MGRTISNFKFKKIISLSPLLQVCHNVLPILWHPWRTAAAPPSLLNQGSLVYVFLLLLCLSNHNTC